MPKNLNLSIYLILDPPMCGGFDKTLAVAEEAFAGGVTIVQLRAPTWKKKAWYELALALKPLCKSYHVPLIINDHIDIALAVDADGVHIGQDDIPVEQARKMLGSSKILGLSTTNLNETLQANLAPIDYIGVGPIFATVTKPDAAKAMGFEEATELVAASHFPSVLIGGLKVEHTSQVKATGANGISVVSAICAAPEPQSVARQMSEIWKN